MTGPRGESSSSQRSLAPLWARLALAAGLAEAVLTLGRAGPRPWSALLAGVLFVLGTTSVAELAGPRWNPLRWRVLLVATAIVEAPLLVVVLDARAVFLAPFFLPIVLLGCASVLKEHAIAHGTSRGRFALALRVLVAAIVWGFASWEAAKTIRPLSAYSSGTALGTALLPLGPRWAVLLLALSRQAAFSLVRIGGADDRPERKAAFGAPVLPFPRPPAPDDPP